MNNTKLTQILLIVVVGLVVVLIFLQGKNEPTGTIDIEPGSASQQGSGWEFNIKNIERDLLTVDTIAAKVKGLYPKPNDEDSVEWFRTAAEQWSELNNTLLAAYYYEKLARNTNNANDWYAAGNRLFNLQNRVQDSFVRSQVMGHAISALKNTIDLAPENLDAKVELGVTYLESGTMPPMAGIGLLKDVEQQNPNHIKMLFYLGYFSMQSGQYQKAIERYSRLTELKPNEANYWQYLGQAHLLNGEKEKAIQFFEKHAELLDNEADKKEALEAIEKLKTKN